MSLVLILFIHEIEVEFLISKKRVYCCQIVCQASFIM
jgi:hypothetical protein